MRATDDPAQRALTESGTKSRDPELLTQPTALGAAKPSTAFDRPFVRRHGSRVCRATLIGQLRGDRIVANDAQARNV
jgi:hypothetical protein